jgi:AcrR family transcriptional regulator
MAPAETASHRNEDWGGRTSTPGNGGNEAPAASDPRKKNSLTPESINRLIESYDLRRFTVKDADTKTRILDAAEKLFATKGFAATSLRTIIREAGVNIAAIHYHFGSREGLIEAVLMRRAAPVNQGRMELLEELETKYGRGKIPLEKVIEGFIAPAIRLHFDKDSEGSMFPRLMSRARIEASPEIHAMFAKIFGQVFMRYNKALAGALPHLSPTEIMWRSHFMVGALAFAIAIPNVHQGTGVKAAHEGTEYRMDGAELPEEVLTRLVNFISAGMRAPAVKGKKGEKP